MPLYHMLQRGGKYGRKYIGISYRVVAEKKPERRYGRNIRAYSAAAAERVKNMEVKVAKSAGFCFGVKRAVDTVYQQTG